MVLFGIGSNWKHPKRPPVGRRRSKAWSVHTTGVNVVILEVDADVHRAPAV